MALSALKWPAPKARVTPLAAEPTVIVGAGPVGVRVAEELLARDASASIVLYGDEPWAPYQRVQLTALALGEIDLDRIANRPRLPARHRVIERYHCRVVDIDRAARAVRDAHGRWQPYAKLILAVGSRPHVPEIPGVDKHGVYTFRDLSDVQRLLARRARSRATVVLGGGLLGVEAARALCRANTDVMLLHHSPRLMNRQLDAAAADRLRREIERLGISVRLSDSVAEILGGDCIERLRLRSGELIPCDTLVVATGIRPRTELAFDAGLNIGQGIRVDDTLRTSDPFIYAIGECAEHRGRVSGLVAPGLEQAAVLADRLNGGGSRYVGGLAAAQLKVVGLPVCSIGAVGDDESELHHRFVVHAPPGEGSYRKLVLRGNRLVGAIAIGDWNEWPRVQEMALRRRFVSWWARARFARSGRLTSADDEAPDVAGWPAAATVCQCAAVSRGTLTAAIREGCATLDALSERTRAGRVCGSCRPLLARLLGAAAAPLAMVAKRSLIAATSIALALSVALLGPHVLPIATTATRGWTIDVLWHDGFWKQASGYTLVGLSFLGLGVSLRKRVRRVTFGDFAWWRMAHGALGALALAFLIAHTGLRFGSNLNFLLMASFTALTALGAAASSVVAFERMPTRTSRILRRYSALAHIVLLWPLPALLGFHILSVYYF
jgi:nitrite reductase (NADH) large subunit